MVPILQTVSVALLLFGFASDDKPTVIKPEEARQHVGKKCEITFQVKKTKHAEKRKKYFLDSEEDFNDEKNLGIQIEEAVAGRLKDKKGVDDPAAYYKDKTIKVVGTVVLEDDRPYIKIEDPDQIDVVEPKDNSR